MPTPLAFYEGDDDRVVLESLQLGRLISNEIQIAYRKRKDHPGKEGLFTQFLPLVSAGKRAIAILDIDEHSHDNLANWFETSLKERILSSVKLAKLPPQQSHSARLTLFELSRENRHGRVALIGVGLPDDGELRDRKKIEQFAIDDYVLRIVFEKEIYASIKDFKDVSFDVARHKLDAMAEMLRNNNLPIKNSKRYLHLLRAIVGFRASSATFIERVLSSALNAELATCRQMFDPLLRDMDGAVDALGN